MQGRQITLYSQPFWGPCAALAEYLTGKNVEFAHKDIMIDEDARDELRHLGVRSTPALVVDGAVVAGFDKTRIDALLNLWSKRSGNHAQAQGHEVSDNTPASANRILAMKIIFAVILSWAAFLTVIGCSDDVPHGKTAKLPERETMRDENTLRIVIRWPGDDFASRQDIEKRNQIERLILDRNVGKIIRVGTGMGWMDIVVAVKDKPVARSSIAEIMRRAAPKQKFTIEQ